MLKTLSATGVMMNNTVPVASPKASYAAYANEIDAAIHQVLDSGHYILGEYVAIFERQFAECQLPQLYPVSCPTLDVEQNAKQPSPAPWAMVVPEPPVLWSLASPWIWVSKLTALVL